MTTPLVTVVGSINQDITVTVDRFPAPGETLLGSSVDHRLGGKGANQAVAVTRTGVRSRFVGLTGEDAAADALTAEMVRYGVDVKFLARTPAAPTGSAHITVDAAGENTIIVVPGANAEVTPQHADPESPAIAEADILVAQCEVPIPAVAAILAAGRSLGTPVVLNLAPAVPLAHEHLEDLAVLVVNETEAMLTLGETGAPSTVDDAIAVAHRLRGLGPRSVVVTLGADGAVFASDGGAAGHVPGHRVERVVDTTGAGDATVGVLAAGIASGLPLAVALDRAMAAGAAAVQRKGAAASYPEFSLT